ncbi:EscG/YscG/SsaH family type III secretion system needle protein co-chaperone [Shewanella sp. VB17]|uniref:EscG/YscG/SsaH family type III secretion system needle protein co-chaperone n=1 Tax=Shewanella sp. VB17 TaxID=2739432 RepID=UPI0015656B8B|nr:EscG/YscG/SsaH family type III secretion system needle protein co-chaperone [Shewanella sp. VB17]NRD74518.1 EscG/YscG/SsaH family type III secretion system needle protein co-chaperone [Shewanella sp. VB17]
MNSEDKQLLVEVAIAASNHGLHKQAYALLAIFPQLIGDDEDRRICTSVIYFALNEPAKALRELKLCHSDAAQGLQLLFSGMGPVVGRNELICHLLTGGQNGN